MVPMLSVCVTVTMMQSVYAHKRKSVQLSLISALKCSVLIGNVLALRVCVMQVKQIVTLRTVSLQRIYCQKVVCA